jgi:acetylserotonin N-methyltransferase
MTSAEPAPILDLIEAFRRSKTMFTAVSLGIFDRLAAQPASAAELAMVLDCNASALARLLDGCAGLGLLVREGSQYANTPSSSRYLVSSSPDSLAGYIVYSDKSLYPLWSHLEDAVREGTNRWEQTFGSRDSLFDHFFRDEESRRGFLGGMHGFGRISSDRVVRAFDLSFFRCLVDLGGATGHLCIAACSVYPEMTATVFDLPQVESYARERIDEASLTGRIRFAAGDFFTDDLPPADLYSLGRILHDWDEDKIQHLLRKIFAALPSGGALLIAEALLNDDRSGPVFALMQNLSMLVCTDGQERTGSDYRVLLESAGFRSIECRRTGTVLDAVLARKS